MKKKKKEVFWMLHLDGVGFIAKVATTRRLLIEITTSNFNDTWENLKRHGYSAKKVEVTEFKKNT